MIAFFGTKRVIDIDEINKQNDQFFEQNWIRWNYQHNQIEENYLKFAALHFEGTIHFANVSFYNCNYYTVIPIKSSIITNSYEFERYRLWQLLEYNDELLFLNFHECLASHDVESFNEKRFWFEICQKYAKLNWISQKKSPEYVSIAIGLKWFDLDFT